MAIPVNILGRLVRGNALGSTRSSILRAKLTAARHVLRSVSSRLNSPRSSLSLVLLRDGNFDLARLIRAPIYQRPVMPWLGKSTKSELRGGKTVLKPSIPSCTMVGKRNLVEKSRETFRGQLRPRVCERKKMKINIGKIWRRLGKTFSRL